MFKQPENVIAGSGGSSQSPWLLLPSRGLCCGDVVAEQHGQFLCQGCVCQAGIQIPRLLPYPWKLSLSQTPVLGEGGNSFLLQEQFGENIARRGSVCGLAFT